MGDEKEGTQEKKAEEESKNSIEPDDEDLLYTHKPESQGNEMRWNTTLCRKQGR
ncbi:MULTISPECIES: hypothetical protein [unclassified Methanosarcina]|uniref:hypothetical protein n=1 Tax=unclassified Methanosarcina TaxID=2644672 RepID=UPI000A8C32F7|nr:MULTISPECIES: hypothetical protein [unclassified Methanosarcina]